MTPRLYARAAGPLLVLLGGYTLVGPSGRMGVVFFVGVVAMAADLTRLLIGLGAG